MAHIQETAHAKINLALHVVGQRADGYHLLESLVTFADIGDQLTFAPSHDWRYSQSGPFAGELTADNLVLRARDKLRKAAASLGIKTPQVAIHLEKNLPVAAGLGGGSADAAACLRGLSRFWDLSKTSLPIAGMALELGADVPMCLISRPLVASGIGERLTRVTTLPALSLVLVNPRIAISTPAVFGQLRRKDNPSMTVPRACAADKLALELRRLRNDLQAPAESIAPVVVDTIGALSKTGALLARMSGSGATCFGIYPDRNTASRAADSLRASHPAWYVEACTTEAG